MKELKRIMVVKAGSPAIHQLGDIRRDVDDFFVVEEEQDDHYIGRWLEGLGFVDVKVAKKDVRPITQDEYNKLNGTILAINKRPVWRLVIDTDGNAI